MAAAVTAELCSIFLPTEASLAHRAHIASQVSRIKSVRPRVPFWQLASHRIPTLWTLYRGLLRAAPTDDVRLVLRFMCQ